MKIQVSLGTWRWLLLSGLGCGALQACGGATDTANGEPENAGGSPSGVGGSISTGTGGTSSGGQSTGTGGESTGTGGRLIETRSCENPKDLGGNWEQCDDGALHRTAPGTCPNYLPSDPVEPQSKYDQCSSDQDCANAQLGYCATYSGDEQDPMFDAELTPGNYCRYGCETDDDCADGSICLCGAPIGTCVQADCTSDAECGEGLRCSGYVADPGCGGLAFACETPLDECVTNGDCIGERQCTNYGSDHRTCQSADCPIGRPFLVAGHERLAGAVARADWSTEELPRDLGQQKLTEAERAAIARAWTRVGLMEHASVAAFARFALQLLQLGAPPELLDATQGAMADETRHARLSFGIAERFDGQPHGPGELPTSDALIGSDTRSIVLTAVLEGCIGETVAAVEAAEAAEHAESPALADLLRSVAEDERRHAELAWKFVAWALQQSDVSLRHEVRQLFDHEINQRRPISHRPLTATEQVLAAHGKLPEPFRRELRARVLCEVVAPSVAALLGQSGQRADDLQAMRAV